jgi:hypothetical protein
VVPFVLSLRMTHPILSHTSLKLPPFISLPNAKPICILIGNLIKGEVVHVWGQEVYGKSLYLPLNLVET